MTQKKSFLSFQSLTRMALALSLISSNVALADNASAPNEVRQQKINRVAAHGLRVSANLSQNIYRDEVVQVPYTETVPYQETETYTENVPYTVTVPYQDEEVYYENEYRCHDVTRYREECRNETRYRSECRNETRYRNECRTETRYRNECRDENKCYIVPGNGPTCRDVQECGTNARGERICKTRRVCEGGSEGRRECKTERTCSNVPYTERVCSNVPYTERVCQNVPYTDRVCNNVPYTDRECRNESVRKTRTVTKYREETRYRQETRTRTVTKYREETRCCRPETKRVFDHQAQAAVEVIFPAEAQLVGSEQEVVLVQLVRAEPADVSVEVQSRLFNYTVARKNVTGASVVLELQATSKMDSESAGVASIQGVGLSQNSSTKEWSFSVVDTLVGPRWKNSYELIVTEEATSREVARRVVEADASGAIQLAFGLLDIQGAASAQLKVRRESSLLPAKVLEFVQLSRFDRPRLGRDGLEQLKDRMQVQIIDPLVAGAETRFGLQDLTPNYDDIKTSYRVILSRVVGGTPTERIAEKTFERVELGTMPAQIKFAQIMTAAQMSQWLRPGVKIQIWVIAKRVSSSPLLKEELKLERSKNLDF